MKPILRFSRSWLLITWACFFAPLIARAQQDIVITGGTNPYITIGRGLNWTGKGSGNIGNNYIFQPVTPDEGFCLFISNNNPTNSHTVTVAVSQTGDPALLQFQGFGQKWFSVPTQTQFPLTIPASTTAGVNYKTTASAGIAIQISGNTGQAGNPDTADMFAVQTTQSSCGALASNAVQGPFLEGTPITAAQKFPLLMGGINVGTGAAFGMFLGSNHGLMQDLFGNPPRVFQSTLQAIASQMQGIGGSTQGNGEQEAGMNSYNVSPWGGTSNHKLTEYLYNDIWEAGSDLQLFGASVSPSFFVQSSLSNPAATTVLIHSFLVSVATVNLRYKRAILTCSAACEIKAIRTTARGTTCTGLTLFSAVIYNSSRASPNANDVAENACTGLPTAAETIFDVSIAAGIPYTLDLSGINNPGNVGSGAGLMLENIGAVTGTVTGTLELVEQPN